MLRPESSPRQNPNWERVLLWCALGIGAVIMVFPFVWTYLASFKSLPELREFPPTFLPREVIWDNWIGLTDLDFGSFEIFFGNSLLVVSIITAMTIFTSSAAGYVFAKFGFWGRDKLFWVVLSLMMVPFSVTLIPLFDLMVDFGWTNNYIALIVPILFNPFGIFLMRQHMQVLPDELIDAARIDGASEYGIFFRVILPLSTAPIAALAIFTFTVQSGIISSGPWLFWITPNCGRCLSAWRSSAGAPRSKLARSPPPRC